MRVNPALRVAVLGVLLVACASTKASRWEAGEPEEISWEEGCQDATTLELICSEGICAFFRCQDLTEVSEEAGEIKPARWPGGLSPPGGFRRWRQPRRGADPVFVIRWYNHPAPILPSQRALSLASLVKHHIFPQEPRLAAWFRLQGIPIHKYTLLISREVHLRIHSGGPRGGRWNEDWRQFIESRETATPEQIWRHAIKLIVKHDLAGARMVPYR